MIPFVAAIALKLSPVRAFLKSIPRPVWIALAVLVALGVLILWHKDKVSDARKEGYAAGVKYEGDRIAKRAAEIKAKADKLTSAITNKLKEQNDEKVRIIYRDAGTVLMRGPAKAACSGDPGISRSSGGSSPPAGQGSSAVDQVPTGERVDLIGLPFPGTVALAQQCDMNRAEAASWREWHRQQSEAWKKLGHSVAPPLLECRR
jgi:hypothetical protein